jgi:hypothetical protein
MIIELIPEQNENIAYILEHDWHHESLSKRFGVPGADVVHQVLLTDAEVQLVIEALEQEERRVAYYIDEEEEKQQFDKEMLFTNYLELELASNARESLESQVKGGPPIPFDEAAFDKKMEELGLKSEELPLEARKKQTKAKRKKI